MRSIRLRRHRTCEHLNEEEIKEWMLAAGQAGPAATTAPVGRAGDDRAQDDIGRAVLTGGPLFLLGVLLILPLQPAWLAGRAGYRLLHHASALPRTLVGTAQGRGLVTHDHDVQLPDGRVVRTRDTGASDGDTVFLLHEPLGSRLVVDGLSGTAADAGLRLVSYDRPGYGGSAPKPGRTVADAAAEVAAIADALGVDRFAVWGQSGSCPFALAAAVLLADRVAAAAVVSPLAPYQGSGLDWCAGMMDDVARLHRLAAVGRQELQPALSQLAQTLTATDPAQFVEFSSPTLPPPDQAILDIGVAARLLDGMREGLAAGVEGAVEDELALVAPWGVELTSVGVPVSVWSGEQDSDTPTSHARWLAAVIPGTELRLFPEEGHLSLVYGRGREVIDWLAERLRRAR